MGLNLGPREHEANGNSHQHLLGELYASRLGHKAPDLPRFRTTGLNRS
ncbi:hypothetical protein K227x_41290 [Rubripirellula lacrimiformis]|uniref:Uncharacterized protein n=1 Tax=Rubripirellula lacrimiformis TaxID=1930273 RepID=A0A517NF23_9BACT|nr:hypothetical protein K227x_41290 [Rubripirellula lacrimiformis]